MSVEFGCDGLIGGALRVNTRIGNEFFKIVVPGAPRVRFCCSTFEDSQSISLLCQWKAKPAKPIMNLQIWDRKGRALAFQYQGHASNIAMRVEQKHEVGGVLSTLTKEHIEASSTFHKWNGILQETAGPALTNSQIELVCNSDNRFRAYLQLSMMCDARELRQLASDVCGSLAIEDVELWQETKECGVEVAQ